MHNNFVDKKRRFINFRDAQIENILPEHFGSYYPKFISLLKKYYQFQDENDSTELLNHLFAARDINETDITLLNYIEDELLLGESYIQGFTSTSGNREVELRAAANFSNILFRSKGTKFAIEWFFRSFYGENVEVLYPKDNVFKIGDVNSQIGADSLRYLTDDKLYQTFALLIRAGIPLSKWQEVFKLFVHPAGMYLGAELFVTDDVRPPVVTVNDIVSQYNSPSYSLTASPGVSANEGTTFTITATGTNVRNSGTDALYWYGQHVTTDSTDFDSAKPLYLTSQYLPVSSSIGTFSIESLIDIEDSPAEGSETFKVFIKSVDDTIYDSLSITLADLIPSYTLTTDAPLRTDSADPYNDTSSEGTTVNFTLTGTNVPKNGQTLYWYIDSSGSTSSQADFETTWPTVSNKQAFLIRNDSGGFAITSKMDNVTDPAETYHVKVVNANNILKYDAVMYLANKEPTLSVSAPSITEGSNFVFTITTDTYNIGKSIDWQIWDSSTGYNLGDSASDARLTLTSGSAVITGVTTDVTIPTVADDTYHYPLTGSNGTLTSRVVITDNNFSPAKSDSASFTISDAAAIYSLTADYPSASEGSTVTFTIGGSNIPDSDVYFEVINSAPNPTDDNDFNPNTPPRSGSRRAVSISGGTGTTTLVYASNTDTSDSDNENYQVKIYNDGTAGTELAELDMVILGDAYVIPTIEFTHYATLADSVSAVWLPLSGLSDSDLIPEYISASNSDVMLKATFNGDSVDVGTWDYWFKTGTNYVTSADFEAGNAAAYNTIDYKTSASKGTFTVDAAGDAELIFHVKNDHIAEGSTTFDGDQKIVLAVAPTGQGELTSSSTNKEIEDISKQEYTIGAYGVATGGSVITQVNEGNDLYIRLTPVAGRVGATETVYVTLSGTGASTFFTTTQQSVVTSTSGPVYVRFVGTTDNGSLDGSRTLTATVRRYQYGDTLSGTGDIGTTTVSLVDGTATYSLNTSTSPIEENVTVTFDVTTTNVSDGTVLYYRPFKFKNLTGSYTSGSPIITTTVDPAAYGVVAGMEEQINSTTDAMGVVQTTSWNGSTGTITMASNATATASNQNLTFATTNSWGWFDPTADDVVGTVTINSNAGTFDVTLAEDPGLSNGSFEFGLFAARNTLWGSGPVYNYLANKSITITNTTTNVPGVTDPVDITNTTGLTGSYLKSHALGNTDSPSSFTPSVTITFKSDGTITALAAGYTDPPNTKYPGTTTVIGRWLANTPVTPGDFTVNVNGSGITFETVTDPYYTAGSTIFQKTGSFNTNLALSTDRSFIFKLETNSTTQASYECDFNVPVTITGPTLNGSDSVTYEIYLFLSLIDVAPGDPGGGGGGL